MFGLVVDSGGELRGFDQGFIQVAVMFSGTIFYAGDDGGMQVAQEPWDREVRFRIPVAVWEQAVAQHYPGQVWTRLSRATFDRLYRYKVSHGIPMWDQLIERLLDGGRTGRSERYGWRRRGGCAMNFAPIEKIADAVLYEGYILYPYRPSSIKNRQRWNFGTLFPRAFA